MSDDAATASGDAEAPPHHLEEYRAKRSFSHNPEPAGAAVADGSPARSGRFVVQRHRARRLHYDLRLELGGVLVSWAVPKGPTLDPGVRRLAVQVEDHPVEYLEFEGVIPKGEYGGGDVIVWDRGIWTAARHGDPAEHLAAGELHVDLEGQRLHGRFVLVRGGRRGGGDERQWILLHKRDRWAAEGWDAEDHPTSVLSGRTNDEVAAAPDALWRSDLPAGEARIPLSPDLDAPRHDEGPTDDELAALDSLGATGTWTVGGRELRLTNLDKVLFPPGPDGVPVTKRDLVRYHAVIAPTMLPYLVDRPVNLHRYPDGVDRPGFWHKEVPSHAPAWLRRWRNDEADAGETEQYLVPDGSASLAWLANFGAIELNPWTSRIPRVHEPTWALIDIDPGPRIAFDEVLVLARLFRTALHHLGVEGRPKVTGKRGVQIWVPVGGGYRFAETRRWVEQVSRAVGATVPDLVSWRWRTDQREGLARLDYTQNAINKTLVAPYSARPAPGAPVSVPLEWDELDDPGLRPDRWSIRTVTDRLRHRGDPFLSLCGREQRLPAL